LGRLSSKQRLKGGEFSISGLELPSNKEN